MKQNNIKILETYSQLKTLSDPFKNQVLTLLIESSYTGQQLSKILEVPRSKVHYALTELESNELIHIVKKEEKNGIIQKFYKAVAKSFYPDEKLIPQASEFDDYYRTFYINIMGRSKVRLLSAPEEAFQLNAPKIALQFELKLSEKTFKDWLQRFRDLVDELVEEESKENSNKENENYYYFSSFGFRIDEPLFEENESE